MRMMARSLSILSRSKSLIPPTCKCAHLQTVQQVFNLNILSRQSVQFEHF